MSRNPNRFGGGAQTNRNGLHFEQTTSLNDALIHAGFQICNQYDVYKNNILIGHSVNKSKFSTVFLRNYNINYLQYNSKRWDPDEAFVNLENRTVYIIEKKFQQTNGSVDEKLSTFLFKKREYEKLLTPIGFHVVYIYLLSSNWFNNKKYKDYFDYMEEQSCPYFFDILVLEALGL